jgi:hypothetical protein
MINIRFGYYFPWQFRLVASVAFLASLGGFMAGSFMGALLLLVASGSVLTATEGTQVNTLNNTLREYTSVLFFKKGKFRTLLPVESIYITQGKENQKMHSAFANHGSTFENIVFNGYLKISSGEKIHLLRDKNKKLVLEKINPLAKGLKKEIVDYTA